MKNIDVMKINDYELFQMARDTANLLIVHDRQRALALMINELADRFGGRIVTVQRFPKGIQIIDLHSHCRWLTKWEAFMYRMFNRLPRGLVLLSHKPDWKIL